MSRGSFVNDLLCAQLHPPGNCRMMMVVVHMVNPNEHDTAAYRAMIAPVNESLKSGSDQRSRARLQRHAQLIEFD